MAKRAFTRSQLLVVLLVGLAVLAWLWWAWRPVREAEQKFQRVEDRIESLLPKDRGLQPTATDTAGSEASWLSVTVRPLETGEAGTQRYWIRVGKTAWEIDYPADDTDEARMADWDRRMQPTWREIESALREMRESAPDAKGRIDTRTSGEKTVPFRLAIQLLARFPPAGIEDVAFEGAAPDSTPTSPPPEDPGR